MQFYYTLLSLPYYTHLHSLHIHIHIGMFFQLLKVAQRPTLVVCGTQVFLENSPEVTQLTVSYVVTFLDTF